MTTAPTTRPTRLTEVPLDKSIDSSVLNIEAKTRSNLFPWNGQFSPQLIAALLEAYSDRGDTILDPFMGSGTVLVEGARHKLRVYGADVNPAPYKIACLYHLANIGSERRNRLLASIDEHLDHSFPDSFALSGEFQKIGTSRLKRTLIDLAIRLDGEDKAIIDALIVLLDFTRTAISVDRVFEQWAKLRGRLESLPYSRYTVEALNVDARDLPLKKDCVDLVLTSPPYINVFNYHQKYRKSVEALGWDLLHVARSEIGANRKHRGNRFLTVIQYAIDLADSLREMCRVLRQGGRIILVIGRESNVRKTAFSNSDLAIRVGVECVGCQVIARQERSFINRFGTRIYEDIIHFGIGEDLPSNAELARRIGVDFLTTAKSYAPDESMPDLLAAIERFQDVNPSPIYKPLTTEGE